MALQDRIKKSGRSILSSGLLGGGKASSVEQDLLALGISEEDTKVIMSLPEEIQLNMIQSIASEHSQQQDQQGQQEGPLGMASGELQGMLSSLQMQPVSPQGQQPAQQDPYQLQQDSYRIPESAEILQGLAPSPQIQQQQDMLEQQSAPVEQEERALSPKEQEETLDNTWAGGMTPEMQIREEARQEKLAFEKNKFKALLNEKEETRRDKIEGQSKNYYTDINQRSKNAYEMDMRLGKMAELVKSDNLGSPIFSSFLDLLDKGIHGAVNISLNLDSLRTTDAQEFNKLSKEFLKGAKLIFGARLTDADVRNFLKMVPGLSQSQEGRARVISNLMIMTEADQVRKNHMDAAIEENGGYRPKGLEAMVERRSRKELSDLSNEFKSFNQRVRVDTGTPGLGFTGRGEKMMKAKQEEIYPESILKYLR